MKTSNNGLRGILDVMLPPRQDMRDEQGNPIQSKVTGGTTRSDFRDQRTGRFHGGLDINYGGPKNSAGNPPVYSPIEGTLVRQNKDNNTIVIRDKNGIEHEFMHFDRTARFAQDQEIKVGDQLGTMGNTIKGVQNGAYHVHYEMSVEVNGARYLIDPEAYHDGVHMDQLPMMDAKKQGFVDPNSVPELKDWARQEQELRETARREQEGREEAKPAAQPPQPFAGADDSGLGGTSESRLGGGGAQPSTSQAEAGEVRQAMQQGLRDSSQDHRPQQPFEEQPRRELPRPVNMLTDLLPPELDPDGSINADLLRRHGGEARRRAL